MGYSPRGRKESDTTERLHSLVHYKLVNYTLIKPLIDLGKAKIKYLHTKKILRPNDLIGKSCLKTFKEKNCKEPTQNLPIILGTGNTLNSFCEGITTLTPKPDK